MEDSSDISKTNAMRIIQIIPDIASSMKPSLHIGTRVFAIIINNNTMIIIINNNMIINMINNNINNNNIIMILITTATATGRFSQVLRSASTSYRCQVCSQVTSLLNSTEGNSAAHQTIKQCHIALTLLVSVGGVGN